MFYTVHFDDLPQQNRRARRPGPFFYVGLARNRFSVLRLSCNSRTFPALGPVPASRTSFLSPRVPVRQVLRSTVFDPLGLAEQGQTQKGAAPPQRNHLYMDSPFLTLAHPEPSLAGALPHLGMGAVPFKISSCSFIWSRRRFSKIAAVGRSKATSSLSNRRAYLNRNS